MENKPGKNAFDEKGINKKLNNLLDFEDFEKNWKSKEQKPDDNTDTGLDVVGDISGKPGKQEMEDWYDDNTDKPGKNVVKEGNEPGVDPIGHGEKGDDMPYETEVNDFVKNWSPKSQKTTKHTDTGLDIVESNDPGIDVFDIKGNKRVYGDNGEYMGFNKLNNLLSYDDFEKIWKSKEQKATKRTDTGLDVVNEKKNKPFFLQSQPSKKRMKKYGRGNPDKYGRGNPGAYGKGRPGEYGKGNPAS
jgi:hypothetical protein